MAGQLATRPLLAIEQITIGGPLFGRAYDYSERSGDRGPLGSGELQLRLLDRKARPLRWAQLHGFADAATVGNLRNQIGAGSFYSDGVGGQAQLISNMSLGLEAAFPLSADRFEAGDRRPRLSANVSTAF